VNEASTEMPTYMPLNKKMHRRPIVSVFSGLGPAHMSLLMLTCASCADTRTERFTRHKFRTCTLHRASWRASLGQYLYESGANQSSVEVLPTLQNTHATALHKRFSTGVLSNRFFSMRKPLR